MGRTVGRFPPILEALFILIIIAFAVQQTFNSMQSYLSSWGLLPVIQRSLVTIVQENIHICPQAHSPLPDPPLTKRHEEALT